MGYLNFKKEITEKEIPQPFLKEEEGTPDFPIEVFPTELQKLISAKSKEIEIDEGMLATSVLGAASSLIGNTLAVQLNKGRKPIPLMLWIAIVEGSGKGKGQAMDFAYTPIDEIQKANSKKVARMRSELEHEIEELIEQIEEAEGDVKSHLKKEKAAKQFSLEELKELKITLVDFTFESLYRIFKTDKRGITAKYGELVTWLAGFGKYSKNGGGSEETQWLEVYDGSPLNKTRAGKDDPILYSPFVTVFGGIQPERLHEFSKNDRLSSGFFYRMLFAFPQGSELPMLNSNRSHSTDVTERYTRFMQKLYNELHLVICDEIPEPKVIPFSDSAREIYDTWANQKRRMTNKLDYDRKTKAVFESLQTRIEMNMMRIAGIIEALKWSVGESSLEHITQDTMEAVVKLSEYYRFCFVKVYDEIVGQSNLQDKQHVDWRSLFRGRKEATRPELLKEFELMYGLSERTFARKITIAKDMKLILFNKKNNKYKFQGRI